MNFLSASHIPKGFSTIKVTYYVKAIQSVSKNNSTYYKVDDVVQSIPSLTQIEITMYAPVLVQPFTHLACASQSPPSLVEKSSRLFSYLLGDNLQTDKKKNRNKNKKKKARPKHGSTSEKEWSTPSPSRIKLFGLVVTPCSHPSLLPLLR